jgi:formamidase
MCWLDRKRIWNNDSTDDVKNVDLIRIHYLSWLIEIEGADGGDAPDVGPILIRHQSMWGFTEIFDQNNGEGFSRDIHPEARKAIWDFIRFMQQVDNVKNVRFSGLSKIFVF